MLPPLPAQPEKSPKQSNSLIYFMVIVLGIGVIVVVAMLVRLQQVRTASNTPSITPTATVSATPDPQITLLPSITPISNTVESSSVGEKLLIGDNQRFNVYVTAYSPVTSGGFSGKIAIEAKSFPGKVLPVETSSTVFQKSVVVNDQEGKYIVVATGIGNQRDLIMIDLSRSTIITKDRCATGSLQFWKQFLVYEDCKVSEEFKQLNEEGLTPDIVAINLTNGSAVVIIGSSATALHNIVGIQEDVLTYSEVKVPDISSWNDPQKVQTTQIKYDLNRLK